MAAIDDRPTGMSDILNFQPPPVQPGLASVVQPTDPDAGAAAPPAANPFAGASQWAQSNPKLANMLLHGFLALSQNGQGSRAAQIGSAINSGVTFGMAQDLANQEQAGKDRTFEAGRQDAATKAAEETRRADISGKNADIYGRSVDSQNAAREVSVAATEEGTRQSKALFPKKVAEIDAKLRQVDAQIATATTEAERTRLLMQKDQLEIRRGAFQQSQDEQFAPAERKARQGQAEANLTGKTLANESQAMTNAALATQSPDVIAGAAKKAPTREERFQTFYKTEKMNSLDGNVDIHKILKDFDMVEQAMGHAPGAADAAGPTVDKAAWETARNSVKPGEQYRGPDGKMYRRGK